MKLCGYGEEKCIIKNYNTYVSKYYGGIKDYKIPAIDPMKFPELSIGSEGDGPVSLKVTFKNSMLEGIKKAKFLEVKGMEKDFDDKEFFLKVKVPELKGTGDVKVDGKMMILKLDKEGKADIKFKDLEATLKCKSKVKKKDGCDHFSLENCVATLKPKK